MRYKNISYKYYSKISTPVKFGGFLKIFSFTVLD